MTLSHAEAPRRVPLPRVRAPGTLVRAGWILPFNKHSFPDPYHPCTYDLCMCPVYIMTLELIYMLISQILY